MMNPSLQHHHDTLEGPLPGSTTTTQPPNNHGQPRRHSSIIRFIGIHLPNLGNSNALITQSSPTALLLHGHNRNRTTHPRRRKQEPDVQYVLQPAQRIDSSEPTTRAPKTQPKQRERRESSKQRAKPVNCRLSPTALPSPPPSKMPLLPNANANAVPQQIQPHQPTTPSQPPLQRKPQTASGLS